MRSILITGCSSGIGLDAARTLKAKGWRVFATCREQTDCTRLQAEGFESFRLDYEDSASIAAAFEETLLRTGGTLNALFNNGAYSIPAAVEDLPVEALRQNFEANLFGWHDLTRRAIKTMRQQEDGRFGKGRIVQCSSVLGVLPFKWRGSYVATKYALEGLTDTLRIEMRDTGISVSIIEPGPIGTRFRHNTRKNFDRWIDWESSARAQSYSDSLIPRLYAVDKTPDPFELGPDAVTSKLLRALEAPKPRARYYVTKLTWAAQMMRRFLPQSIIDRLIAKA